MKVSSKLIAQGNYEQVIDECAYIIPEDEVICVALKGTFKEYLICTTKMVYIIKKGFMTGHTIGRGELRLPYNQINNAEVVFNFASGYFELSSAGFQNKHYNYWSNDNANSPQRQPNVISLTAQVNPELFRAAARFIIDKIGSVGNGSAAPVSKADELMKYATLFQQGLLTKEEFEAKKRDLL